MRNTRYKVLMLIEHGNDCLTRAKSIVDTEWYANKFPSFSDSKLDPYLHFFYKGWKLGFNPNPIFYMGNDGSYSVLIGSEKAKKIRNLIKGHWQDSPDFLPFFDSSLHKECENSHINNSNIEALMSHLELGCTDEPRLPPYSRNMVDADWYTTNFLSSTKSEIAPHVHFFHQGWKMGNNPHPAFHLNEDGSARNKISVKQAGRIRELMKGALAPDNDMLPLFDPAYYRANYPDLGEPSDIDAASHFLAIGYREGRISCAPAFKRHTSSVDHSKPEHREPSIKDPAMWNSPLIIAGFHRSGTSMTSEMFQEAGLFIGDELLGANDSNKYGHFEDLDVVKFHDELLAASGTSWQTSSAFIPSMTNDAWLWLAEFGFRRAQRQTWGFKDPRVCLFLAEWAHAFPNLSVLYVHRPAIECVASLKRRAAADMLANQAKATNIRFWRQPDLALRMYLTYARASLRFLESFKGNSWVVSLDNIKMGQNVVKQVSDSWGYDLSNINSSVVFDNSAMTEVTPNEAVKDASLIEEVDRVEQRFVRLINKGPQIGTMKQYRRDYNEVSIDE